MVGSGGIEPPSFLYKRNVLTVRRTPIINSSLRSQTIIFLHLFEENCLAPLKIRTWLRFQARLPDSLDDRPQSLKQYECIGSEPVGQFEIKLGEASCFSKILLPLYLERPSLDQRPISKIYLAHRSKTSTSISPTVSQSECSNKPAGWPITSEPECFMTAESTALVCVRDWRPSKSILGSVIGSLYYANPPSRGR